MPRVFPKPATNLNFLHIEDDLPRENRNKMNQEIQPAVSLNTSQFSNLPPKYPITAKTTCRLNHKNQEMNLAMPATPLNTITTTPIFPNRVCNANQHYKRPPRSFLAVSATPINTTKRPPQSFLAMSATPLNPKHDHPNLSSQTLPYTHETCNVEIY